MTLTWSCISPWIAELPYTDVLQRTDNKYESKFKSEEGTKPTAFSQNRISDLDLKVLTYEKNCHIIANVAETIKIDLNQN